MATIVRVLEEDRAGNWQVIRETIQKAPVKPPTDRRGRLQARTISEWRAATGRRNMSAYQRRALVSLEGVLAPEDATLTRNVTDAFRGIGPDPGIGGVDVSTKERLRQTAIDLEMHRQEVARKRRAERHNR